MTRPEGAFHRAPRPLTAWAGTLLTIGLTLFTLAVLTAIALGFWRTAAQGLPVPDLTGGLANFAPVLASLGGAGGLAALIFRQRHVERRDEIARGSAPSAPFAPSPPSGPQPDDIPGGGLVNNEALQ